MRIFGSERIDGLLQKLGLKEGEAIFHPWMNKAIEKAQQKVEARNYEIRKNLLKFDDVMNDQRKVIYEQRIEMMTAGTCVLIPSPPCARRLTKKNWWGISCPGVPFTPSNGIW